MGRGFGGRWGEGGVGGGLLCSECQGCARDLHALCASGLSLTSPIVKNSWVLAAGTIEDVQHRGEEIEGESLLLS